MTAGDIFRRIIGALDAAGIPHMLTGSFASSFHGSPRATQDVDLVIDADARRLETLIRSLPAAEYYADEGAALEALAAQSQFNIIDLATGWKIDLIIRRSRPFSLEEFSRRTRIDFEGIGLALATAEDVIIAKLEWAKVGGSARQLEDVASILRVRANDLDAAYLARWVSALGLAEEWSKAEQLASGGGQ